MRSDPLTFVAENESQAKRPRYVIKIELPVESIYITSHAGISGVPGVVLENCLQEPSAISQRIVPDEGRSEIGSFSFTLVDVESAFTDEVRDNLLNDGVGLRGKKVLFYIGYARTGVSQASGFGSGSFGGGGFGEDEDYEPPEAVFSQFQLFQTQIITDVSYQEGVYEVRCSDITREQRKDIFEPKKTTLRDSVTAAATTIPVYSTVGFQPVHHGTSYSDGPNGVFGYIKLENEIIRYPVGGVTTDSFTGCTRGVLNTKAVAHEVDAGSEEDRRPKVDEYIYIELPAVKAAYAIMTGVIHGTSPTQTLPPHWHLGISTDLIKLEDFTQIGTDLWDTSDDTAGFLVRFTGLGKADGKRFLETEVYQLLGSYSPVYSDGRIGLKRMNQVLANAAYVVELNETNVVSTGALQHEYTGMHNQLRIDWNWNGDRFTRTTLFIDSDSVSTHGAAPLKTLKFKGLHGARHTEAVIRKRLDAFRDRYTSPPETIAVEVLPSLNKLEVGDIVRLKLTSVRDFAGEPASIDRSFEVQRKSESSASGNVSLDLFGSTAPASSEAPNDTDGGAALPDAFYTAEGTELSTVVDITVVGDVGVTDPGTFDLPSGIYYYDGDLTVSDGTTITINGTVQLRVAGFMTVNGDIDGVGRGKAGQADVTGWGNTQAGLPGFLGNSRGMDGLVGYLRDGLQIINSLFQTVPCAMTQGLNSTFPFVDLQVSGDDLLGIPTDLAGTSGGAGGKLGYSPNNSFGTGTVSSLGGTGADSGAGLAIICRGFAVGASGEIDLSGDSPAATSTVAQPFGQGGTNSAYPGPGGAGCPGALFIALDGSSHFVPDLGGKFIAATGTVPINGSVLPVRGPETLWNLMGLGWGDGPFAGFRDPSIISAVDLSNVAFRIQYIPQEEDPQEDQNDKPPAPTNLAALTGIEKIRLTATVANLEPGDLVEFYASNDNNRTNATLVGYGAQSIFVHSVAVSTTQFFWTRIRRPKPGVDSFSEFFPSSATGGTVGSSDAVGTGDIDPEAATALYAASDAGPDTYNSGTVPGSPNHYLRIDGDALATGEILRARLTTQMSVANPGELAQCSMLIDWGAGTSTGGGAILECYDTLQQSFATEAEFVPPTPPVGTAWTLTVRLSVAGSTGTFTGTRVALEVIKR